MIPSEDSASHSSNKPASLVLPLLAEIGFADLLKRCEALQRGYHLPSTASRARKI